MEDEFNVIKIGRRRHHFGCKGSSISCGVAQVYNLPSNKWMTDTLKQYGEVELIEAIKKTFEAIKIACHTSTLILSDTEGGGRKNLEIFGKFCTTSKSYRNPNTGNNIRVLIY